MEFIFTPILNFIIEEFIKGLNKKTYYLLENFDISVIENLV